MPRCLYAEESGLAAENNAAFGEPIHADVASSDHCCRGRILIFWRTKQTMEAARPGIRVPVARGLEQRLLPVAIDHRERYPWRFPRAHTQTERRELPVGDYGIFFGNSLVAAVERKSLTDLISAASTGSLRMKAKTEGPQPYLSVFQEAGTSGSTSLGFSLSLFNAANVLPSKLAIEFAAREDLLEIARTIARDNPGAAQRPKDEIVRQIGLLADFPELGPFLRDGGLGSCGYRILTDGNYLVFCLVAGEEAQVKRVLHGARLRQHLLPE